MSPPVLEISQVTRNYHGLRPLRVLELTIEPGDHIAVLGVDQPAAETLVNLVTGTMLPDEGLIRVLGRPTSDVGDSTAWLAMVDRFGIVSERAVLLDALSVLQNLALPLSLDIEPLTGELRGRAEVLAREAGLPDADWDRAVGDLESGGRLRLRLGRALALDPAIVVLEHPSAGLARADVETLGREIRGVLERRRTTEGAATASLTLTADPDFAHAVATRVWTLDPTSGRLTHRRRGWFFGRGGPRSVE